MLVNVLIQSPCSRNAVMLLWSLSLSLSLSLSPLFLSLSPCSTIPGVAFAQCSMPSPPFQIAEMASPLAQNSGTHIGTDVSNLKCECVKKKKKKKCSNPRRHRHHTHHINTRILRTQHAPDKKDTGSRVGREGRGERERERVRVRKAFSTWRLCTRGARGSPGASSSQSP